MKTGFYIKTAWNNIKKNYRFYIPQILTGTGLLACLYIVYTLKADERIIKIPGGDYMPTFMSIGTAIISQIYHDAIPYLSGDFTVLPSVPVETELIHAAVTDPDSFATIMKENDPNPLDSLDPEEIINHKEEIIGIIEEIPSPGMIIDMLKRCDGMTDLSDMGLDPSYKEKTARLSPYVRARLTLMRILKYCSFYEEIIR